MDFALFLKVASQFLLFSAYSTLIFNLLTILQASAGVITTLGFSFAFLRARPRFTGVAFVVAVAMFKSNLLGFVTGARADQNRAVALDPPLAVFVFAGDAAEHQVLATRRQVLGFDFQKLSPGRVDQADQLAVALIGSEVEIRFSDPALRTFHDQRVKRGEALS